MALSPDRQKELAERDKTPKDKTTQKDTGWRSPLSPERVIEIHSKKTRERAANKKDVTKTLPPGLNPLKYSPNPTPEVPATLENLTTLVTENLPIVGNVIKGVKMLTDEEYDPINPYGQPTGTAPGYTADPSQIGETAGMGVDGTLERASPVQKKKKKVEAKPGFTLLQGAGGTLLGG